MEIKYNKFDFIDNEEDQIVIKQFKEYYKVLERKVLAANNNDELLKVLSQIKLVINEYQKYDYQYHILTNENGSSLSFHGFNSNIYNYYYVHFTNDGEYVLSLGKLRNKDVSKKYHINAGVVTTR